MFRNIYRKKPQETAQNEFPPHFFKSPGHQLSSKNRPRGRSESVSAASGPPLTLPAECSRYVPWSRNGGLLGLLPMDSIRIDPDWNHWNILKHIETIDPDCCSFIMGMESMDWWVPSHWLNPTNWPRGFRSGIPISHHGCFNKPSTTGWK